MTAEPTERSPLLRASGGAAGIPGEPDLPGNGTANGTAHAHASDDADTPASQTKVSMAVILPSVAVGILLAAMDQTIIFAAYPKIGNELHELNKTPWIASAYLLTLTSFQPLYGKLSDIFGRKACLLTAYFLFGIGSLLCGLATGMDMLIAARAFQGIGGGGMTTVVSILMSDIVPLRKRGTYQGIINIIFATGAGLGAPLGGFLADSAWGWRSAFLMQVPLTFIAFCSVVFALHLPKQESQHWKEKLKRVDFAGAITLVAAVFFFMLGLDRGGNVAWSTPLAYGSLIASATLFIAFVLVERFVASEPFAPGRIVFERSLLACYLCNFFSFASYMAAFFHIPLFFQAVDGVTATEAGIRIMPAVFGGVTGSLLAGKVMEWTGRYYWLTVAAYSLLFVGGIPVLLFSGVVMQALAGIIIGLLVCGFGNGIGVTSTLIALISNAAKEDQAIVTACSYLFRSLGSLIGVTISSTILQESLRQQLYYCLGQGDEVDKLVKNVRESLDYIKGLSPSRQQMVLGCYEYAVQAAITFSIILAGFSLLSSFFIKEASLNRR